MFWTTMWPSSGETNVSMWHLVFVTLCGWLSGMQGSSYFSWWWAHSHPKHVEKRNKHTKKNCAPIWLYLQDYVAHFNKVFVDDNEWQIWYDKQSSFILSYSGERPWKISVTFSQSLTRIWTWNILHVYRFLYMKWLQQHTQHHNILLFFGQHILNSNGWSV